MQYNRLAMLSAAALLSLSANAATLRWAASADFDSFDVHAMSNAIDNTINYYLYDSLIRYSPKMEIEPGLAQSWRYDKDKGGWFFKIRQGVKFHEGETLTADDVVFSLERAGRPTSKFKFFLSGITGVQKIDDSTVFLKTSSGSPVTLNQLIDLRIMCKSWCAKHGALDPQDYANGKESYAAMHENGTGPYRLETRRHDAPSTFVENKDWWNKKNKIGNVDRIEFCPIASAASRTAALISGQIDFVYDPATQDLPRLEKDPNIRVLKGLESRTIFLAMDQLRDNTPYVKVAGKTGVNPFKDVRVRKALEMGTDEASIARTVMRKGVQPTGCVVAPNVTGWTKELDRRLPYDVAGAKKLLAEAGYPNGFEFTLNCPNNRYVNDENFCRALVTNWAKLGLKVTLHSEPKAQFFPRMYRFDTSCAFFGWGSVCLDALTPLQSFAVTYDKSKALGTSNIGRFSDAGVDAAVADAERESDPKVRAAHLTRALKIIKDKHLLLPFHALYIPWAMRKNVTIPFHPANRVLADWAVVK